MSETCNVCKRKVLFKEFDKVRNISNIDEWCFALISISGYQDCYRIGFNKLEKALRDICAGHEDDCECNGCDLVY